jgi:hypothetical protein
VSAPDRRVGAAARILRTARAPRWLTAWARRTLVARTPSLAQLQAGELAEIVGARDPARTACVLGWAPAGMSAQQVINAVDRPGLVGPAAILLSNMELATGELSTTTYNTVVLNSAGDANRTRAALFAVRRAPERILAPQRQAIFTRAWHFAAQPVDPYAPSALHDAARSAAASLLAEHADLRSSALADISDAAARQLRLVYAAGLQGAHGVLADTVAEALATMKPSKQAALTFARDCDRDFSAADPLVMRDGQSRLVRAGWLLLRRPRFRVWRWVAPTACLIGVPAAGAGLALAVNAIWGIHRHVMLDTGTIVAVAAVLVAIHVVASELAADRLPGLVARATSIPLPLWAGYGCVLALYGLAVWQPDRHNTHIQGVLAIGVIGTLAVSLALSLRQLLSRTDNTVAARIFTSGEVRRAIRSGRAVGRMNRAVLAARSDTAALMWVRPTMSAPLSVRRAQITSTSEGYLVMQLRILRRLGRGEWWHEGARLWLSSVLGTLVHPGDEVASIVPTPEELISERTLRDANRLFTVRKLAGAERTGEAIGALIELTSRLAEAGNEPGASRVAHRAVEVLHAHLGALHVACGAVPTGDVGAPVGVARSAALALSHALAGAEHPASREVLSGLAQRALPGCTQGDSFLAVLIGQLATFGDPEGDPGLAQNLMWDCGRRAVELGDRVIMRLWWESVALLARNGPRRGAVLQMAGRVVQYASVLDSPSTESAWQRLLKELDLADTQQQLIVMRVGASALLVGNVSMALLVAHSLPNGAWTGVEQLYKRPEMIDYETTSDQVYGHLLGAQADLALNDYVRFGIAVAEYVS